MKILSRSNSPQTAPVTRAFRRLNKSVSFLRKALVWASVGLGLILIGLVSSSYLQKDCPKCETLTTTTPPTTIIASGSVGILSTSSYRSLSFDKLFVLTLARRSDRHKWMRSFAEKWQLDFENVYSVNGKDEAQLGVYRKYLDGKAVNMTTGEIATFGSHFQLWQIIAQREYNHSMIFEDDDVIGEGIRNADELHALVATIMDRVGNDYDLIYFGHCYAYKPAQTFVTEVGLPSHLNSSQKWSIYVGYSQKCGHGYAVSKAGAKKLLKEITQINDAWDVMVDILSAKNILKSYVVYPPVFDQLWLRKPGEVSDEELVALMCSDGKYVRDPRCWKLARRARGR